MAVKFKRSRAPTAVDRRFSSTGIGMGGGGEGGRGGGEGGGKTKEVSQRLIMQPCCSHHFRRLDAARAIRFLFMSRRSISVNHARCFALRILSNLGSASESLKGHPLPRVLMQSL